MKILYREHRGEFAASMKSAKHFGSVGDLVCWLMDQSGDHLIKIEWYCYDDRIKSETFIVTDNNSGIGFMWFAEDFVEPPYEPTKRALREFNYWFENGASARLNEELMNEYEKDEFKQYLGKDGIIVSCTSDLHAYGRGSVYMCKVEFGEDVITCLACILDGGRR